MTATLWLITEGEADSKVLSSILEKKGIPVRVKEVRLAGSQKGVSRLAAQLETLIEATRIKAKPGDCIVVLHDADLQKRLHLHERAPYKKIAQICKRYRLSVTLTIAYDELEAWLLADASLAKWLGTKPTRFDDKPDAAARLNYLIDKAHPGLGWNKRYYDAVLKNIDASGDKLSDSMREALNTLRTLPCAQSP